MLIPSTLIDAIRANDIAAIKRWQGNACRDRGTGYWFRVYAAAQLAAKANDYELLEFSAKVNPDSADETCNK